MSAVLAHGVDQVEQGGLRRGMPASVASTVLSGDCLLPETEVTGMPCYLHATGWQQCITAASA
jgi:hypothetical protein